MKILYTRSLAFLMLFSGFGTLSYASPVDAGKESGTGAPSSKTKTTSVQRSSEGLTDEAIHEMVMELKDKHQKGETDQHAVAFLSHVINNDKAGMAVKKLAAENLKQILDDEDKLLGQGTLEAIDPIHKQTLMDHIKQILEHPAGTKETAKQKSSETSEGFRENIPGPFPLDDGEIDSMEP